MLTRILPGLRSRIVVRSPTQSQLARSPECREDLFILLSLCCFRHTRDMVSRISEWLTATEGHIDPSVRLIVTADQADVSESLARDPRLEFVGRLNQTNCARCGRAARPSTSPPASSRSATPSPRRGSTDNLSSLLIPH